MVGAVGQVVLFEAGSKERVIGLRGQWFDRDIERDVPRAQMDGGIGSIRDL